jgi:hypothetical protein
MEKESPTTYRVGTLSEFAEWTKSVVRDPESADGVPKKWFDSEETAAQAATDADGNLAAATAPSRTGG